jgi:two-component system, OmpR family, phosphate regulon sensor histidine kinase PhoR
VTFARRVVTGSILVLLIALGTLVWVASRALSRSLESDIAHVLEREARLIAAALPADSAAWQATVRRYSQQTGNRITVVDRSGRVVADSDFPTGPLPPIESHADRAEVAAAFAGGTGRAVRYSSTVDRELMYVAVPGGPGVVRAAEDLSRVQQVGWHALRTILLSALIALAVGAAAAALAARSVGQPLSALAAAARAIAAGSPPRFPRSGVSEIDALVRALREMHQQLGARFSELRQEKAESAALVESMVEGVVAADARGRVTIANSAARALLGYEGDRPLPDLLELFRSKPARGLVNAALAGEVEQARTIELDDRTVLATARGVPSGGAVLVLHDVTELRKLEAVRRDFVANVSHELRTPLTSICGYTETLLTDRPDDDTSRRFLEIILSNGRRMQRLVDDLLDLSRIESGRWQPAPVAVDAAAAAREIWAALSDRPEARTIRFDVEVAPDPPELRADPDALRQVLTNLLDNSLRHTPAGGSITCRVAREDGGVAVSVRDSGIGIAREHLPRIFERFYRADASRSRDAGGTGLGLAIVKHLVEGHGGRVTAESAWGLGTTVTCWFPA